LFNQGLDEELNSLIPGANFKKTSCFFPSTCGGGSGRGCLKRLADL
jgi:hypothetical protein